MSRLINRGRLLAKGKRREVRKNEEVIFRYFDSSRDGNFC